MRPEEIDDKSVFDLLGLGDIKNRPDILSQLKFDVTPQMMMEPRFHSRSEDVQKLKEISGYMFYIETESETPALMLMKIGRSDITTTVARIDEIPSELIQEAIRKPVHPPVYGMYAISGKIREWLKKELGL